MADSQPAIDPSLFTSPDAPPLIGDSGHLIQIEPIGEGGVKVSVTYQGNPTKDKKILLAVLSVLIGLVAILWLLWWFGIANILVVAFVSFIAPLMAIDAIRQYSIIPRSYVVRADKSGLSLSISDRNSSNTQHFTRHQIVDISVACGIPRYNRGPATFSWWVVISTTVSSDIRIMQDLDGSRLSSIEPNHHHLRRIANALRAALGMPQLTED